MAHERPKSLPRHLERLLFGFPLRPAASLPKCLRRSASLWNLSYCILDRYRSSDLASSSNYPLDHLFRMTWQGGEMRPLLAESWKNLGLG